MRGNDAPGSALTDLQRIGFGFRLGLFPRMVRQPGFGNLIPDADHRIQGVFRVLHNH